MRTLIINFKNYPEAIGENAVRLAEAARDGAGKGVELVVAPPAPMLGAVARRVDVRVFAQRVTDGKVGQSTGALIPESVRASGAIGTLLNHSEARETSRSLRGLVPRTKLAGLRVCLCAKGPTEARALASLGPDYIALEPPELIGTGVAVSRAKPELISRTVRDLVRSGFDKKILCGAGIIDGRDVSKAVQLGVEGVLVSSGVVKAKNWRSKVSELADALVST